MVIVAMYGYFINGSIHVIDESRIPIMLYNVGIIHIVIYIYVCIADDEIN